MPTPARTSRDALVAAGRSILEEGGLPGLTMQAVAHAVGVRAPSLYKHVEDRGALIRLVADAAALDLSASVAAAGPELAPLARAVRTWAHAHPEAFRLVFSGQGSPDVAPAASAPVLHLGSVSAGPNDALNAARLVTAWATGFISMELAGAFRLGGDVDEAFEFGIARLAAALSLPLAAALSLPLADAPAGTHVGAPTSPDIVVSAVVLRNDEGHILTVRKEGTSRFMLPGGKREQGETAADAAIRECREELGISLELDSLAHLGTFLADAANEPGLVVEGAVFAHRLVGAPRAAAEIAELRWLDPSAPRPRDLAPLLEHHVLPVLTATRHRGD